MVVNSNSSVAGRWEGGKVGQVIMLKCIFLLSNILKALWNVAFPLTVLILAVYFTTLQSPHYLEITNAE